MNDERNKLKVPLFTDLKEPDDYDFYIHGGIKEKDSFGKALKRYVDEIGLDKGQVAALTGISRTAIYNYYKDLRNISYEYLIILCIALRLHPMRQEYLFSFVPAELKKSDSRYYIIKSYLINCAFMEECTLDAMNKKLRAMRKEPFLPKKKRLNGDE